MSTRAAGLLILALGIWGGLVPFVGHYFHFSLGPDQAWHWSRDRLFLNVLPGVAAVLGGLMLIGSGPRRSARLGALLAIASGIWFAIGPDVSHLWNAAGAEGRAHGVRLVRVLELITYHTGLGALIAALGGYALPRFIAPEAADGAAEAEAGTAGERRAAPVAAERTPAGRRAGVAAAPPSLGEREQPEDAPERERGWEDRPAPLGTPAGSGTARGGAEPAGEAEGATVVREPPGGSAGYAGDDPVGVPAAAEPIASEPAATAQPGASPATVDRPTAAQPVAAEPPGGQPAGGTGATQVPRGGRRRTGGLLSRLTGR